MPRKSARGRHKTKTTLAHGKADCSCSSNKRRKTIDTEQPPVHIVEEPVVLCHVNTSDEVDSLICEELPDSVCRSHESSVDNSAEDEVISVVADSPRCIQSFQFIDSDKYGMCFNPLPLLDWAEGHRLWEAMKAKEEKYSHSTDIFEQHPDIKPNMRAVLMSWLTEVCEVYCLLRETYYLAVEFIDRFLLCTVNIKTSRLQLIGVTSLFMASKIEEIYPPKIKDFAYVSDGACHEDDIRDFELFMAKVLDWFLSPATPNTWLQLYLQLAAARSRATHSSSHDSSCSLGYHSDLDTSANSGVSDLVSCTQTMDLGGEGAGKEKQECAGCLTDDRCVHCANDSGINWKTDKPEEIETFDFPMFSNEDYVRTSQLMDLVVLDSNCLQFTYSELAAAAMYLTTSTFDIFQICCLTQEELDPCVQWMKIHKAVLDSVPHHEATAKPGDQGTSGKIQTHFVSEEMWQTAMRWSDHHFQSLMRPTLMGAGRAVYAPPLLQCRSESLERSVVTATDTRDSASQSRCLR